MTFKHLFLKDYDESSDSSFAVYTQSDVYEHIFYAVEQVRPEEDGKQYHDEPLSSCLQSLYLICSIKYLE